MDPKQAINLKLYKVTDSQTAVVDVAITSLIMQMSTDLMMHVLTVLTR